MGGGGACVCWLCVCDGVPLASLLRTHRPTHPPTNHTTHPLQLEWEQQQAAAAAHLAQYAGGQYWGGGGGAAVAAVAPPPPAAAVETEHWIECDTCKKWRLLPA